jgi:hypothetical protein
MLHHPIFSSNSLFKIRWMPPLDMIKVKFPD